MNTPTAKNYIYHRRRLQEMCMDAAWFIKNKHHILLQYAASANVIIPFFFLFPPRVKTGQRRDDSGRGCFGRVRLAACVAASLCEPRGETRALFLLQKHDPLSPTTFEPSARPFFFLNARDLCDLSWPPLALQSSSCSSFQASTLAQ